MRKPSPANHFLKGDNVMKVLMGKKGEAFQFLSDSIESSTHTHGVLSGLSEEAIRMATIIFFN